MRRSILILTMTALLTVGLVSFGIAQMMGSNHGQSSMGQADSTSQSSKMGMMNGKMGMGMMGDMSQKCKMMSNDFDKLQKHFDAMMQMDDMKALKTEMKKHQEMMQAINSNMSQHRSMCMNMMSGMKSGGKMMNGCPMMGAGNQGSDNAKGNSGNH